MARPPRTADDFALEEFLTYLAAQGFPCGVGERVSAYRLYAAFRPHLEERRMRAVLCPVFARSAADQERFYQAHDLFFAADAPAEPPTVQPGVAPLSIPDDTPARRPRSWRTWRHAVAAVAVTLVVAAVFFDVVGRVRQALIRSPSPPTFDTPPPREGYVTRTTSERVETAITRACAGLECVTRGARPWLLGAVAILFVGVVWLMRTAVWRRRVQRAREKRRGPPFSWPILRHSSALRTHDSALTRASDAMRLRLAGEVQELDVRRTIDATTARAGFPIFVFRPSQKLPEYLFLIERRGAEDHLARWWTEVGESLRRRGVAIATYYYEGDLRRCVAAGSSRATSTIRLLDHFPNSHVLLFGRGRDLLQGFGEVPGWLDAALVRRDRRALLTAAASFEWGVAERKLASQLPVLPGRLANLPAAAAGAGDHGSWRLRERTEMASLPAACFDETMEDARGEPPALSTYLDEDVFQWLCACAVAPELQWHLTLQLATIVDPTGRLLDEAKLLQLFRLTWFRDGRMPGRWREWLLTYLEPRYEKAIRTLLLDALERDRAPRGSYARDLQDAQIAAQRYWLSQQSPARLREAQAVLRALPDIDTAGDLPLHRLRSAPVPDAGGGMRLWARLRLADLRIAAASVLTMLLVVVGMVLVPVADTRTDVVNRVEQVPAPSVAAPPPTTAASSPGPAPPASAPATAGPTASPRPSPVRRFPSLTGQPPSMHLFVKNPSSRFARELTEALRGEGLAMKVATFRSQVPSRSELRVSSTITLTVMRDLLAAVGVPVQIAGRPVDNQTDVELSVEPADESRARLLLKLGDRGAQVDVLQRALARIEERFKIPANGVFDAETETYLRAFQRSQGLQADGAARLPTMVRMILVAGQRPSRVGNPSVDPAAVPPPTQPAPSIVQEPPNAPPVTTPPAGATPSTTPPPQAPAMPSQQVTISAAEFSSLVTELGDLLFERGSVAVPRATSGGWSTDIEVEKLLREYPPGQIAIVGHAGPDEGTTAEARQELSVRRALAVRQYLLENMPTRQWSETARNALPARLTASGLGSTRPICTGPGEECTRQNRRVQLVPATAPSAPTNLRIVK